MQQQIPEELEREIAQVAAGLNLTVDDAVRQALQSWVQRVVASSSRRLPDPPILTEGTDDIGTSLPPTAASVVSVVAAHRRQPDGIGLE